MPADKKRPVNIKEETIMKKATKVLALILAMAMMACTLVACGSSADTTAANTEAACGDCQGTCHGP